VAISALGFLGLAIAPQAPDWGRMIFDNQDILAVNPWAVFAPALMIVLTAAAVNIVADWGYDRLEARGRAR
jgi:peptide/nickel transport system permease protein